MFDSLLLLLRSFGFHVYIFGSTMDSSHSSQEVHLSFVRKVRGAGEGSGTTPSRGALRKGPTVCSRKMRDALGLLGAFF